METMVFIILLGVVLILLGVVLIDAKLWKVVLEQRRHDKAVEGLLAELRDRLKPQG
jgi:sulfite exporter TauE/SafE